MRERVAVGLLTLLASLLTTTAAAAPPRVEGELRFTRPDGTPLAFGERISVRCGAWEPGVPVRSIHVFAGSRRSGSFWLMSAVLADVRTPTIVRLPNSFVFDEPEGALLFAVDRGENELSSAEEEASGRLVFERAGCRPKPHVTFRVNATLGSEFFDGESVRVRGRLAVVSRKPTASVSAQRGR